MFWLLYFAHFNGRNISSKTQTSHLVYSGASDIDCGAYRVNFGDQVAYKLWSAVESKTVLRGGSSRPGGALRYRGGPHLSYVFRGGRGLF